jgi:aldose sugar dehydrogenase
MKAAITVPAIFLLTCACNSGLAGAGPTANEAVPFDIEVMANFDAPWAMTFIPGTQSVLISEKKGKLLLWQKGKPITEIAGVPKVDVGGQGGFGDVILSPRFTADNQVYLSWIEAGEKGTRGAVVATATLSPLTDANPQLVDLKIIWRQSPKVTGRGHYSHRMAFSPDGKYLFIGSGERQKFDPAQNMDMNLGKVVRLYPDGSIPLDNPFYTEGNSVRSQIWSLGHRNILGLAFDADGQLWNQEMGPQGGDELNLVKAKANYGYPVVSNGNHYDGRDIPDHKPGDGFEAPKLFWNPVISPAGLMYYNADLFPEWKGSMFIGGLSSEALIRVKVNGQTAEKAEQWSMGTRIREVEQGPDGAVWVLEDGDDDVYGRLLRLTPKQLK